MVCISWSLSQYFGRRSTTGDGTRGQLSFGSFGGEPTCTAHAGRHCLQQRHGHLVQTHYPGTWFLDGMHLQGCCLALKIGCSEQEGHGRISTSVDQGEAGKVGTQPVFLEKVQASFHRSSRPHRAECNT